MNIGSHMNYYDNYIGSMDIMQLGQFDSKQDDDNRVIMHACKITWSLSSNNWFYWL